MPDQELLNVLNNVKVPEALTNCRAFVDHLRAEVSADRPSETPEEGFQRVNQMLGVMTASHLELISTLTEIDRQLRVIGQRLPKQ